ncbi:hypothetical protein OAO12_01850 [Methylophilaceae bacterium]|nr:hypothetical protein [Methylophilaceae bacterium]
MCGIFYLKNTLGDSSQVFLKNVSRVWKASSRRGSDSSGIYVAFSKNELVHRDIIFRISSKPENILNSTNFKNLILRYQNDGFNIAYVIGHTRMNTDGSSYLLNNNQPLSSKNAFLVFNGIITNVKSFKHPKTINDGYILLNNFNELQDSDSFSTFINNNILGAVNCIVGERNSGDIQFYSNNGSLYVDDLINPTIIISEPTFISNKIVKRVPLKKSFSIKNNVKLERKLIIEDLDFKNDPVIVSNIDYSKKYSLLEAKFERVEKYWKSSQVRCTKCILPSTHPFISFDNNGVCNFCRSHKPIQLKDKSFFINQLQNLDPNKVMLGFSGGRDSSYALHLLTQEYGIKPLTYTYDWGVNTNLARRNVSRMCGKLGVENVLIAADIRRKRNNVRLNLLAWLKHPHPGLIPLLMAGDKQFISNANIIKKERSIEREIFAFNLHEKTQFKEDFTGVKMWKDTASDSYGEDLRISKQILMILFYVKQGLLNPSLINTSLLDTARGFYNYYHSNVNILQIFEYNDWNESILNTVLANKYDWEFAGDTSSSWRIGDGTAAFYNIAYYMIAGFTENDVIRSNLIRENKLTRKKAIALVDEENKPRLATLNWYLKILNLDITEIFNLLLTNTENYRKQL